jgi:hypothetical protein
VSGNTTFQGLSTHVSSLNVSGTTTSSNVTTCLSTLSGTTINATQKIFFNNTLAAAPALGVSGGNSNRLILYAGTVGTYPYSLRIDNFTQYSSVPFNSVHRMFIADTNRFEVAAGAVSVNTSLTTNGSINITSSGTNKLKFDNGLNGKKIEIATNNFICVDTNGMILSTSGQFRVAKGTNLNDILSTVSSVGDLSFAGTIYSGAVSTSGNIAATSLTLGSTGDITTVRNITASGTVSANSFTEGGVSLASKYLSSASLNNYVLEAGDTMTGNLNINSSTQLEAKKLFTGQEFYAPSNSMSSDIAFLLSVNSIDGNKQLWIADSTDLTQNGVTSVLRLMPTTMLVYF